MVILSKVFERSKFVTCNIKDRLKDIVEEGSMIFKLFEVLKLQKAIFEIIELIVLFKYMFNIVLSDLCID